MTEDEMAGWHYQLYGRASWVTEHCMAHGFIELHKHLLHDKAVVHEEVHHHCKTLIQNVRRNRFTYLSVS